MDKIKNKSNLLIRSHHTVNTIKLPLKKAKVIKYCEENKIKMTNFRHYLFGGEIYDEKL